MSEKVVPLRGFGGGGTSLNFKVVGNPQPANPKENTIWVNTDQKITGYYFQAEQPENMVEGELWIGVRISSRVAFNALKKNSIIVYPTSVKQMSSGVMVERMAQIWQNGKWNNLENNYYVYDSGQYAVDISGEWIGIAGANDGNVITMSLSSSTRRANAGALDAKFDLTDYSTLTFVIENHAGGKVGAKVCVYSNFTGVTDYTEVASNTVPHTASATTVTIDVTSLSGLHYIGAYLIIDDNQSQTLKMSKIYLT